jgi:hypothetical protein
VTPEQTFNVSSRAEDDGTVVACARGRIKRVVLRSPRDQARKVLQLAAFDQVLTVED